MTTSVCMAVYNGERFIREQLLSIANQTCRPDEVILCDDGSTDGTIEIIEAFLNEHHLTDSWKLYRSEQNKGYPGNFYYAISLCTGDVVYLADQDDIWHKQKIEKMNLILSQEKEMKVIACKFGLIDETGGNIRTLMAPTHAGDTGTRRQISIADVFYKCEWPGMVMAFRREWYQRTCAVNGQSKIPHDFMIAACAAETGQFVQLDEELAWHRRHENNAGEEEHRLRRLLNKSRKLREIEKYLDILKHFEQEKALHTEEGNNALKRKLKAMQGRYSALQSGKIKDVLDNARQNKEQVRLATVVCDLLIVKRKR